MFFVLLGARNWREPRERWGEREFAGRDDGGRGGPGGPERYNRSRSWDEEGGNLCVCVCMHVESRHMCIMMS